MVEFSVANPEDSARIPPSTLFQDFFLHLKGLLHLQNIMLINFLYIIAYHVIGNYLFFLVMAKSIFPFYIM